MTIHLPEDLETYIHAKVLSGQFATEDAAVAEAVRRFKQWELEQPQQAAFTVSEPLPAWQRVLENMKAVPDEIFDRIPADSSAQLDHYLYGTPKRSTA